MSIHDVKGDPVLWDHICAMWTEPYAQPGRIFYRVNRGGPTAHVDLADLEAKARKGYPFTWPVMILTRRSELTEAAFIEHIQENSK